MSQNKKPTLVDDPANNAFAQQPGAYEDASSAADDAPSRQNSDDRSPDEECKGLRRSAMKATHRLAVAKPRELTATMRRQLQDLCRRVGAIDAHLFRIRMQDQQGGILGLRYHAALAATDEELKTLRRFPMQLVPSSVQEALLAGHFALLRTDSNSAGRLLTALMKQMQCRTYLLVPITLGGRLQGMLGIARREDRDINELPEFLDLLKLNGAILLGHVVRVRQEQRRSRNLRRWRKIANHACDFAFRVDERGTIVGTTPFGMSSRTPSLDGLRLTDIVTRSFHRPVQREITRAVNERHVRTHVFQLCLGHEGPCWYLARIEPAGPTASYQATLYLTDNNADKVLQEENRDLTDKLLKASRMGLLGQMSTEFAHQLNQPLQAILNYCNTMQRRLKKGTSNEDNCARSLDKMEASVLHAASIINRIRDFVRFRQLHIVKTTVGQLIDDAVILVVATARQKNADLVVDNAHADQLVSVDRTQTTHVFVNIIINALEACSEAGVHRPVIKVRTETDFSRGQIVISFADNGPGLPQHNPECVFEKFFTTKEDGLGMGLAISRDVCVTQGGSLTAGNNADGGCTFVVTAPLAVDPGSETAELRRVLEIDPDID